MFNTYIKEYGFIQLSQLTTLGYEERKRGRGERERYMG
jgi:hypothetical protein